jgi:hypothetical protein
MATDHRTQPTEDDAGKDVIDSTGETIGIVSGVEGDTLHVESDPGLTDSIKATLGWGDTEGDQIIEAQHIAEIDDDAVHLAAADPEATDIETEGEERDDSTTEAVGETGTGTGHEDAPTEGDGTLPEERRDDPVDGQISGDETAAQMDDAGDVTEERTTGETGADEMTDEQVSEREADSASDEMGVPAGEDDDASPMDSRDANERPPGVEDTAGSEDVHDSQLDDPRGEEDVQDPVPEEPRDTEDVRENTAELDPEDEPSTGEAATRGVEEEGAELGRQKREDDENDDRS